MKEEDFGGNLFILVAMIIVDNSGNSCQDERGRLWWDDDVISNPDED